MQYIVYCICCILHGEATVMPAVMTTRAFGFRISESSLIDLYSEAETDVT